MPENYYCLDNFFHKVTDMESPRKNNDCYFYYYSTCTKGDSCTFRHEPSALGCETTCSFWKEGKCINVRCNFRHMELRKNRKVIPCYWESQPGGCLKPHCPFLHQNPKHLSLTENQGETSDIKTQDLNKGNAIQNTDSCSKNASQGSEKSFGSPVVDPLVVNFEEESDNESAPTHSPLKTPGSVKVKTLEEIRLERIQAESAAYYSYPDTPTTPTSKEDADDLRRRIINRLNKKTEDVNQDIEILSLDEIKNRKRRYLEMDFHRVIGVESLNKRQKTAVINRKSSDLSQVKVKTLEEIRAERAKKFNEQVPVSSSNEIDQSKTVVHSSSDSEVSSTSKGDLECNSVNVADENSKIQCVAKVQPIKRLKRRSIPDEPFEQNQKRSKIQTESEVGDLSSKLLPTVDTNITDSQENENVVDDNKDELVTDEKQLPQKIETSLDVDTDSSTQVDDKKISLNIENNSNEKRAAIKSLDSSKLDEVLLLDDEEFESNDTFKAEEDILKDIDELLNQD